MTDLNDVMSDVLTENQVPAQEDLVVRLGHEELRKLRARQWARDTFAAEKNATTELPAVGNLATFLAEPDEALAHRVAGLWPTGGRVVLSAPHKSGKTTTTGNLVRSLADGHPFLDHFTVERASRVVLLDNELDERMLRRWLRDQQITNTGAIEVIPLRGRLSTFNIIDPATRTRWAHHIGPADVVLFDCLRPALDALGLSEDKDAGRFLEAFDEFTTEAGIAETLMVHHMGHNGERSRGDSRILDWPDAIWKLVKDKADSEGEADDRRVYFTAYGRDVDHPETLLQFDAATRHLTVAGGSRKDSKVTDVLSTILAFLGTHPGASKNMIEKGVDGRNDNKRQAIKRGIQDGTIRVEKSGVSHLHYLTSPISPNLAPGERANPSADLAPSPIGRGRGRGSLAEQPQPHRGEGEPGPHLLSTRRDLVGAEAPSDTVRARERAASPDPANTPGPRQSNHPSPDPAGTTSSDLVLGEGTSALGVTQAPDQPRRRGGVEVGPPPRTEASEPDTRPRCATCNKPLGKADAEQGTCIHCRRIADANREAAS